MAFFKWKCTFHNFYCQWQKSETSQEKKLVNVSENDLIISNNFNVNFKSKVIYEADLGLRNYKVILMPYPHSWLLRYFSLPICKMKNKLLNKYISIHPFHRKHNNGHIIK